MLNRLFKRKKKEEEEKEVNPFTGEYVEPEKPDYEALDLRVRHRFNQEVVSRRVVKTLGYFMLVYNGVMTVGYLLSGNVPFFLLFAFTSYYVLGFLKYANREDANR